MIICPKCNNPNSDNTKCFYCGETLPVVKKSEKNSKRSSGVQLSVPKKKATKSNSEKIDRIANVVCVIGIILAVILGFIFQIATVKVGVYSTGTTYSYNWGLLVGTIIATLCFTIILKAMSYIAKAIEEK